MVVTFYCKDPDSQGDQMCETFYSTDVNGQLFVPADGQIVGTLVAI
ncbi:hypothetical protein [Actinomadura sp. 3N508]